MTGLLTISITIVLVIAALLFVALRRGDRRKKKETEDVIRQRYEDDLRIHDLEMANAIRKRSASVPDRVPPSEPTRPAAETRKGRRGAL